MGLMTCGLMGTNALVSKIFYIRTAHCCIGEMPTWTDRLLYLGMPYLLSCQVVPVGQLPLMGLEVPKKRQRNQLLLYH